jgi:hypothetical protein
LSVGSPSVEIIAMVRYQISDELIATYIDPDPNGLGRSDARLKRSGNDEDISRALVGLQRSGGHDVLTATEARSARGLVPPVQQRERG